MYDFAALVLSENYRLPRGLPHDDELWPSSPLRYTEWLLLTSLAAGCVAAAVSQLSLSQQCSRQLWLPGLAARVRAHKWSSLLMSQG
jgi:hypothetical protein